MRWWRSEQRRTSRYRLTRAKSLVFAALKTSTLRDGLAEKDAKVEAAVHKLDRAIAGFAENHLIGIEDPLSGEEAGLVHVKAQAGEGGESGDLRQQRDQLGDVVHTHGQVVRESVVLVVRMLCQEGQEDVVAEDEEEGREGATLFDPAVDLDRTAEAVGKEGPDRNHVEEAGDGRDEPEGQSHPVHDCQDKGVINGIEGLLGVQKKKELLLARGEGLVVGIGDPPNMIGTLSVWDKVTRETGGLSCGSIANRRRGLASLESTEQNVSRQKWAVVVKLTTDTPGRQYI